MRKIGSVMPSRIYPLRDDSIYIFVISPNGSHYTRSPEAVVYEAKGEEAKMLEIFELRITEISDYAINGNITLTEYLNGGKPKKKL